VQDGVSYMDARCSQFRSASLGPGTACPTLLHPEAGLLILQIEGLGPERQSNSSEATQQGTAELGPWMVE
jgi:hypothetical protein